MAESRLRSELNQLERKLVLLLSDFKKKDAEIEMLKLENQKLKLHLEEKDEKMASFQNQDKISKIVNSMVVDENDTEALSNLLSEYINEVDKCIAHLSE
ncbi:MULTISPECIES: hypothetical protein [Reichenbachiella]|uniref:Uncharacterized protein n=1 Tax=Reichenbachiella agariperforans TaxID=156994 RepID=A0A1M6M2W7_REIAG|nr:MULTISPECIES: hypothetical protein [Reichenbachiella]MBU2914538.1 hypothetical protein [Reichenbachiella agariperforans]RJE73955.1 hypothetical protein BGP76_12145 [Reichenbachiella sp. MSK19-1]SHJ77717.1 hypothetical protein SAMN04488028_1011196 [Reichenbachiella agariperforans]